MVLIPLTFCFTNDRVMMSVSPATHRLELREELMKTNASPPVCPDLTLRSRHRFFQTTASDAAFMNIFK
jgi:hypothetical protein